MDERATSLAAQRDALASGTCSSTELIDGAIDRHDQTNASLNAVLGLRADAARAEAKESDVRRAAGELRSPIDGIPILLKDNMVQRGEPTTCSSRILEGYVSPYDSCVVEKLQAAGAIIMGRTNMDEFAMGSSTENSVVDHLAGVRLRWQRALRKPRSGVTRVDRFANPRVSAVSRESNQRTAACRAGASSPTRRPSIKSAVSPIPRKMRRSCCKQSPVMTNAIQLQSPTQYPITARHSRVTFAA
jgi:hypothetical protein